MLPKRELKRVRDEFIEKYYSRYRGDKKVIGKEGEEKIKKKKMESENKVKN